ncbi:MAG: hypothetical protein PHW04_13600 [Candidatus Wallbacteria bacterium]|nr:hypothetical protein [Candidatus Wallbacteria bacterium]
MRKIHAVIFILSIAFSAWCAVEEGVPDILNDELASYGQESSSEPIYFPHIDLDVQDPETTFKYVDGQKVIFDGTESAIDYTRLWLLGNAKNIKTVYICLHGDHQSDYSVKTEEDRNRMEKKLKSGEGAIVAYPVSPEKYWPAFQGGENGMLLISIFNQIEKATGKNDLRYEQFALSGGGRLNHALLNVLAERYDTDEVVREFVDNHLKSINDGDSLCYGIDSMKQGYISAIKRFKQVRFCFIHNTSGYMEYVHKHHNDIAMAVGNQSYPYGGSLVLEDGRLRFWAAPDHFSAWCGQFERVFFGSK